MYPAPTSTPQPDATPVPIGRRAARKWVAIGAACYVIDLIGVFTAFRVVLDPVRVADPFQTLVTSVVLMILFGSLGAFCIRYARRRSRVAISTDFAGLWLTDGDATAVVPWNDLAAIGLHEFVQNAQGFSYSSWSIELHLHEPIEPGDPLIDRMVLAAGPPRYMIRLPRGTHIEAMAAIKARVPELWMEAPDTD